METLLLASSSPRRKDILRELGIPFVSRAPDIDETLRDELPPAERVLALAEDKARRADAEAGREGPRLVLAADTLVCVEAVDRLGESVLGKPADRESARRMMRLLSGRDHLVHTGLALLDRESRRLDRARSDSLVRFAPMSEAELEDYLDWEEWRGVAGGYRIQGAAALYIERIEGSWSGIVGLPIRELYGMLARANFRIGSRA